MVKMYGLVANGKVRNTPNFFIFVCFSSYKKATTKESVNTIESYRSPLFDKAFM